MKKLITYLKIHTPWYICHSRDVSYYEQNSGAFLSEKHFFNCGEICDIEIYNDGMVAFLFKFDITEKQVREYCSIFLYFISICNGYNCEFSTTANIDDSIMPNFFTYAKEDKTELPLLKNSKFYEIALDDIKSEFSNIINKLFSNNRMFIISLLSNYYSMVFYKDFIGNGVYKFRNIVANIESIITVMNNKKYNKTKNENEAFLDELKNNTNISKTKLKKHLAPRQVSLKDKLKDAFEHMVKYGLLFKLNLDKECEKIANTRNFVSHLFDAEKDYLSDEEMYNYSSVFEEMFRMLFLEHCGLTPSLIQQKFLQNTPICVKFKQVFNIDKSN